MFEMSKNLFYIKSLFIYNYTNYIIHGISIKLSDIGSTPFYNLLTI